MKNYVIVIIIPFSNHCLYSIPGILWGLHIGIHHNKKVYLIKPELNLFTTVQIATVLLARYYKFLDEETPCQEQPREKVSVWYREYTNGCVGA